MRLPSAASSPCGSVRFLQVCIVSLFLFATHGVAAPFAYIADSGSNTVSVIDIATNTVVGAPSPVGAQPFGVAANLQGTRLFIGPGAPVTQTGVSTIPMLSEWAVVLLALLVAVTAAGSKRR